MTAAPPTHALVTGVRGFVGPHLAAALLRKGIEVAGMVHKDDNLEHAALLPKIPLFEADIRDAKAVCAVLEKVRPQQIYHLAAISNVLASSKNPRLTYDVNVGGTTNLFESVRELGLACRILHVSSAHVYGSLDCGDGAFVEDDPISLLSPYAASKYMTEVATRFYVETFGMEIVVVRPFNHIGPGQTADFVCSAAARQFALMRLGRIEPRLQVGNLEAERDFTDVRDVVEAYWIALNKGSPGEVYNICSGTLTRIRDVIAQLAAVSEVNVKTEVDPTRLRRIEAARLRGDPTRILGLGWKPCVPLRQSLADLFRYWLSHLAVPAAV